MTDELKPCPFCGGKAEIQCELEVYCVMCTECNAHGTTVDNWHEGDEVYSEAIAAWNHRADARQLALKTGVCPMCEDCPDGCPVETPKDSRNIVTDADCMQSMRLIDADELRDKVLYDSTYDNDIVNYYLDWIDNAPTIDAVPVLWCENCKHYNRISCSDGFDWCERIPDKDAKRPIMAVTYWFLEEGKTLEEDEVIVTIFRTEEELGKDHLYTGRQFFEGLGIKGRCTGAIAQRVEVWQRKDQEPGEMMLEEYIRLRQER